MAYTTINKSGDYFNTKLYTGNGSAGNGITGVGFQPDWTWIKNRDAAYWHQTFDAVRGASAGALYTNETSAEDYGGGNLLASFDSDGFTVNTNAGCNANGQNLVAWNWKANGTGSANTAGSINSTVSVNTTAGFSIVSYTGNATTGATIGHGLGVTPDLIIAKSRVASDNWGFFHSSFSSQQYMFLNTTAAVASASSVWNALPSSSVFTVGDNESVNDNGNMIAYCFAEKKGYSKFGSFEGNNNANGTFVYLGFKPSLIITKNVDTGGTNYDWLMFDNKRNTANLNDDFLEANNSDAETTSGRNGVDFLSNGFKCRTSYGDLNSNQTYIYMAFAEAPLVGTNNVPCTAR
jgi:hypothetical protein